MLTSMCPLLLVCGAVVSLGGAAAFPITLRSQHMSTVGRQEWIVDNVVAQWTPAETAVVVVDMWNKHWCKTATTRVGEIAVPMNETLSAARKAGIHIVFAPSDVTSFYAKNPARLRTLSLPNATLPPSAPSRPAAKVRARCPKAMASLSRVSSLILGYLKLCSRGASAVRASDQ